MAYALVAHAIAGSSTGNNVTTAGVDTTGATLIVLLCANFAGGSIVPTDSKGNTWTADVLYQKSGDAALQAFYCVSPIVGAGHTFTLSSTGKLTSIEISSWSGALLINPHDQQNGQIPTVSMTSEQPGSITPTLNGELVITGYCGYANDVSSINSGFTLLEHVAETANHLTLGMAYIIQTTAAAVNPTWTISGSNVGAANIVSFKVATGGGDVTVAITGQSVSVAQGTVAPASSVPLTGQGVSVAQGTVSPALSAPITGQDLSLAQGSVAQALFVALVGQGMQLATGTVTPSGGTPVAGDPKEFDMAEVPYPSAPNSFGFTVTFLPKG